MATYASFAPTGRSNFQSDRRLPVCPSRRINIGPDKLVFVWSAARSPDTTMGEILQKGMRKPAFDPMSTGRRVFESGTVTDRRIDCKIGAVQRIERDDVSSVVSIEPTGNSLWEDDRAKWCSNRPYS
jgi:hypothetical protein